MKCNFTRGIAISALLIVAPLGVASAADLALKAPPPPPPVWSWTGWYVGGNLGYSWGRDNGPVTLSDSVTGPLYSVNSNTHLDGVIGGLQVGHNWQTQNWVYGLEADIQASGQRGNTNVVCPGGTGTGTTTLLATLNGTCSAGHFGDTAPFSVAALPVTDSLSEQLKWFGTVRARVGPTITPTVLPYITGGLAYGQISATNTVSGTNIIGTNGVNGPVTLASVVGGTSNSTLRAGWTIGGGIEGVLWGNWTGKIEYLYIDLGTVSGTFNTTITTPAGNTLVGSYSSHVTDNILRVGVNYNFR
jgi:outer membrane immunogenic protein